MAHRMKTILYFQSQLKTSALKKLDGIREIAAKLAWHVQVVEVRPTRTVVQGLVGFWHPVGAIVECASRAPEDIHLDAFGNLPVVFLDAPPGLLRSTDFNVAHDSARTGREAARSLLNAGFTRFAYIAHPVPYPWSDERRDGFVSALKLHGFHCPVLESVPGPSNLLAFQRRLAHFLRTLPRPTAIFAANDTTAEAVLAVIYRQGYAVTEDFALLAVDNFEPVCEPLSLSSVEPDFRNGGNLAMFLLSSIVRDGRSFSGQRQLKYGPLRVVNRATTRTTTSPSDRDVAAALDLIHREACTGLKAETVLASFACSRALAASRFKRVTGHTVLQEIHHTQLARVQTMLQNPRQQIKSISDFCGFRHPNSLKKLFKRETGLSLREWRRRNATLVPSPADNGRR